MRSILHMVGNRSSWNILESTFLRHLETRSCWDWGYMWMKCVTYTWVGIRTTVAETAEHCMTSHDVIKQGLTVLLHFYFPKAVGKKRQGGKTGKKTTTKLRRVPWNKTKIEIPASVCFLDDFIQRLELMVRGSKNQDLSPLPSELLGCHATCHERLCHGWGLSIQRDEEQRLLFSRVT